MALWGNKDSKTASGTIEIAANGNVTGTTTSFTTEAKDGDYIRVSGEDYLITAISSNTAAVVTAGVPGATLTARSSGSSYTLSEKPEFVTSSESASTNGVHGDPTKVFGVDTTEVKVGGDNVASVALIQGGAGYGGIPTVSFTGGGGSSAAATATVVGGVVTAVTVTNTGTSYTSAPTVVFTPKSVTFDGATAVNDATEVINVVHSFANNDAVVYSNGGGTSIGGLTDGNTYYIIYIDANNFRLSATSGGSQIDLTDGVGAAHTLTHTVTTAATATASLGDATVGGSAHAGWVRRIVGTGGRAGRIQYETLVAMGSMTGDQADDIEFRDN